MIEIVEHPKIVTSRKQHKCCFCNGMIEKGDSYERSVLVYDGIYAWKSHIDCSWIASKLKMYDDIDRGEGLGADVFNEIIIDTWRELGITDTSLKDIGWFSALKQVIDHYKSKES